MARVPPLPSPTLLTVAGSGDSPVFKIRRPECQKEGYPSSGEGEAGGPEGREAGTSAILAGERTTVHRVPSLPPARSPGSPLASTAGSQKVGDGRTKPGGARSVTPDSLRSLGAMHNDRCGDFEPSGPFGPDVPPRTPNVAVASNSLSSACKTPPRSLSCPAAPFHIPLTSPTFLLDFGPAVSPCAPESLSQPGNPVLAHPLQQPTLFPCVPAPGSLTRAGGFSGDTRGQARAASKGRRVWDQRHPRPGPWTPATSFFFRGDIPPISQDPVQAEEGASQERRDCGFRTEARAGTPLNPPHPPVSGAREWLANGGGGDQVENSLSGGSAQLCRAPHACSSTIMTPGTRTFCFLLLLLLQQLSDSQSNDSSTLTTTPSPETPSHSTKSQNISTTTGDHSSTLTATPSPKQVYDHRGRLQHPDRDPQPWFGIPEQLYDRRGPLQHPDRDPQPRFGSPEQLYDHRGPLQHPDRDPQPRFGISEQLYDRRGPLEHPDLDPQPRFGIPEQLYDRRGPLQHPDLDPQPRFGSPEQLYDRRGPLEHPDRDPQPRFGISEQLYDRRGPLEHPDLDPQPRFGIPEQLYDRRGPLQHPDRDPQPRFGSPEQLYDRRGPLQHPDRDPQPRFGIPEQLYDRRGPLEHPDRDPQPRFGISEQLYDRRGPLEHPDRDPQPRFGIPEQLYDRRGPLQHPDRDPQPRFGSPEQLYDRRGPLQHPDRDPQPRFGSPEQLYDHRGPLEHPDRDPQPRFGISEQLYDHRGPLEHPDHDPQPRFGSPEQLYDHRGPLQHPDRDPQPRFGIPEQIYDHWGPLQHPDHDPQPRFGIPEQVYDHLTSTPTNSSTQTSSTSNVSPTSSSNYSISSFFLSFHIVNLEFTPFLKDSNSHPYMALRKNISSLFLQIYRGMGFLGISFIQFRKGSVAVNSILTFQNSTINAKDVEQQLEKHISFAKKTYNMEMSKIMVDDVTFPSTFPSTPTVPGWGIALLVLVSVVAALAVLYFLTLVVCHCRRKTCGDLDLLPPQDAYHPMSEYPTYHTHGRYVPPGSTRRSPYEEVSAGNGGSSLSYTNLAATSANL
ncbi:mucin-1 [Suncus etruscus]|uniref:mucin-1 n=1 Tax=Suncus etruscus TaxID=109475 RepID=UPI0021107E8D|nr:mucin-1 [Suncus etruscus]